MRDIWVLFVGLLYDPNVPDNSHTQKDIPYNTRQHKKSVPLVEIHKGSA